MKKNAKTAKTAKTVSPELLARLASFATEGTMADYFQFTLDMSAADRKLLDRQLLDTQRMVHFRDMEQAKEEGKKEVRTRSAAAPAAPARDWQQECRDWLTPLLAVLDWSEEGLREVPAADPRDGLTWEEGFSYLLLAELAVEGLYSLTADDKQKARNAAAAFLHVSGKRSWTAQFCGPFRSVLPRLYPDTAEGLESAAERAGNWGHYGVKSGISPRRYFSLDSDHGSGVEANSESRSGKTNKLR